MQLDPKDAARAAEFAEKLPSVEAGHTQLMLVGNALARPMAQLRANQAAMEAARAKLRHGAKSDAYAARRAEAEAAERMVASVDAEIARLKIQPEHVAPRTVSVYGYVRAGDEPVADGRVELVMGDAVLGMADLHHDGSFTVEAQGELAMRLQVTIAGVVAHRDDSAVHVAGPIPMYRLIELKRATKPRPTSFAPPRMIADSREDKAEPVDPASVAALPGMTLHQGLTALHERSVMVAAVRLRQGKGMTPRVTGVRTDEVNRAIAIDAEVRLTNATQLKVLATMLAIDDRTEGAGIVTIDDAQAWLKKAEITTLEEAGAAADEKAEALRRRGGIETLAQARKVKQALAEAVAKIEVEPGL